MSLLTSIDLVLLFLFYWSHLQFVEPRINVMLIENCIDAATTIFFGSMTVSAAPI